MRNLIDRILFAPPGEGDGGGAPPAGAGDPPPADPAAAPAGGAAPPAGGDGGNAGDPPPEGQAYRPEGLADNLYGKTDRETIDNMKRSLDGYRQRDSQRGAPDDPAAYSQFGEDLPDLIKPHMSEITKDPFFSRMASAAKERGMPVKDFQGLVQDFMSGAAEAGFLEPPIDVEAEQQALTPENARHLTDAEQRTARETRMNDNFAYLDQMAERGENGGMPKDVADYAKTMLGDSAKGHQFIEWIRGQASGGKGPTPQGGNQAGTDQREDLQRRAALPENTPGNAKFDQKSFDTLQADYQRIVGD